MLKKNARKRAGRRAIPPKDYIAPDGSIGGIIREAYRALSRSLQARIIREGVTIGMWFVLRALWEEDGLTQRQIGTRIGINGPSTVTQLNAMERAGLVRRVPNRQDRRKINVFLTEQGRQLKAKLWPVAVEVNRLATRGINKDDKTRLTVSLQLMLKNLAGDRG